MDKWAEAHHARADGQFGFRQGKGTVDSVFVLNHIIERYRGMKKPLYTAFIDFRKAYDKVVRRLLWECLEGLGISGPILSTLKGMYENVRLQVRVAGVMGEPFTSSMGVKQGDPLSPLLFGLFIDRVESFIREKCPTIGVSMMGRLVQVLLYADDLVLMANSPTELQQLLDCLGDFCAACGLTVNVRKSEVVVYNSMHCSQAEREEAGQTRYQYGGQDLKISPSFIYLGVLMADGKKVVETAMPRNR